MRNRAHSFLIVAILVMLLSSGCSTLYQPVHSPRARLGEETPTTVELKNLPEAKNPIIVAVYKFRDQTGQYKPSENGNNWSTAITQGATTILTKALEDSKWFIPIERENVSNLLNERKIIRSSRAQYNTDNNQTDKNTLPPLLYAGVILEGGIISYDANIITGGNGVRYFGAGASNQYRQDRLTVYLRAVSTSNGKVLKTVYTSKTILSQALDAGLFRYVRFGRLLEAETGLTYNEPSEMALTEAIEKAVMSLIIEGVNDNLWELKEDREKASKAFLSYEKEKKAIPKTNMLGQDQDNRRKKMSFHLSTASILYQGDYPDSEIATGMEIGLTYAASPAFSGGISYGLGRMRTKDFYDQKVSYLNLQGTYRFLPYNLLTPSFRGSVGILSASNDSRLPWSGSIHPKISGGVGVEYFLNKSISLTSFLDYHQLLNDELDEVEQGKYNDYYWQGNIGLNFYFGKKVKSKRGFKIKRKNNDF